jgi:hypothetical protein
MNSGIINCDVLVTGGGSAGIAAAVAASRKGASVVLLEKNGFIGGKATAAYVGTICGLYYCNQNGISSYVSDGFAREFAEKLIKKSGTLPVSNKQGLHFLPYHSFDFKILCDEFIHSEKIKVFFHSVVSDLKKDNGKIISVKAVSYDRVIRIQPKTVIDCTGEALLSTLSGSKVIESESYQSPAQVFSMEGIEALSEANLSLIILKEFQKAISEGILSDEFSNVSLVPGSLNGKRVYLKIGISFKINNKTNKISPLELKARSMVATVVQFLKDKTEAFRNARIGEVAPEVGVRTGRRHMGKYILTKEDVLTCKKTIHSAGRGAWPIEFWEFGKRVHLDFFEFDDYYDIPKDCLISSEITNLFFAGRNISSTEEAIASARVIGTCLQTGYTAGEIAADYIQS